MALTGLSLDPTIRTNRVGIIKTAIDAGTAAGHVKFYSVPLPTATGDAISTQTLLGTCTLSYPCGTVSGGVLTFSVIADETNAPNSGTIAFGRIYDSTGAFVADGLAGTSGAVFNFNTLSVVAGGIVRVLAPATITDGNA